MRYGFAIWLPHRPRYLSVTPDKDFPLMSSFRLLCSLSLIFVAPHVSAAVKAQATAAASCGRNAHQAIWQVQADVKAGYRIVVDLDLAKCFDTVDHDRRMNRLGQTLRDQRRLALIGSHLRVGVLVGEPIEPSEIGTPQGGPLSPLLANMPGWRRKASSASRPGGARPWATRLKSLRRARQLVEPPAADPHGGWCGGRGRETSGYPIRCHFHRTEVTALFAAKRSLSLDRVPSIVASSTARSARTTTITMA